MNSGSIPAKPAYPSSWLVTNWGFHDVAAAGCVHTIAGLIIF